MDDVRVLRELGEWAAEEASNPRNQEKVRAWYAHDAGSADRRTMVLTETWYLEDSHPVPEESLLCKDPIARSIERGLRQRR